MQYQASPVSSALTARLLAAEPEFVGLERISGAAGDGYLRVTAVSADGQHVVGMFADPADTLSLSAFLWTRAGGLQRLGSLNGGRYCSAEGISAYGRVVVGTAEDGAAEGADRAFRWTRQGGLHDLGTLNYGRYSHAYACSADGLVVVGDAAALVVEFGWGSSRCR